MTAMSAPTPATVSPPSPSGVLPITRVASIDAFRGFVMFLMLAEVMRLWTLHDAFPSSGFWAMVAFNTTHVPWQGCSLHDLIQPAFSFLAGASLPFSIASRRGKGETFGKMLGHAVRRSLILIFLGIFLRSMHGPQTYWTFEDTLTQIGLGYTFLFLLAFASFRVQAGVFVAILVGFWAAFALYPLPPASFDYASVGVAPGWPHLYTCRGPSTRGSSTSSPASRRSGTTPAGGRR
jgi:predicted acyltransferase